MESPPPVSNKKLRRFRSSSLLGDFLFDSPFSQFSRQNSFTTTFGIDDYQLKSAFLNLTVFFFGGLIVLAIYYNLILLQPYFAPLFWAVMWSIPLHSIKKTIAEFLQTELRVKRTNLLILILSLLKILLKVLLGPLYYFILRILRWYQYFIYLITPYKENGTTKKPELRISYEEDSAEETDNENNTKKKKDKKKKKNKKNDKKKSSYYFKKLFQMIGLYLTYQFFIIFGVYYVIPIILCLFVMVIIHILATISWALLRTCFPWIQPVVTPIQTLVTEFRPFIQVGKGLNWISSSWTEVTERMKESFFRNIHSILAIIVIILFLNTLAIVATIFVVKVGQETNALFDAGYSNLNHIVQDANLHNRSIHIWGQANETLLSWANYQVQQYLPESNAIKMYAEIKESFDLYYQKSMGVNITKPENIIIDSFPVTNHVLESLVQGNVTNLSFQVINEALREISALGIKLIGQDRASVQLVQEYGIAVGRVLVSYGISIMAILGFGLMFAVNSFLFAFEMMFKFLLFLTSLYYLLASERGCLEVLNGLIIFGREDKLVDSMEASIKAIFESSVKMYTFHILFTWLTFNLFGADFVYISSFVSGFMAVLPFASPWVIAIPYSIHCLTSGKLIHAFTFMLVHFAAWWKVDDAIYSDIPNSHPLIAGLSIILGLYAFNIYGVLLGPILATVPVIVYHFLHSQLEQMKQTQRSFSSEPQTMENKKER